MHKSLYLKEMHIIIRNEDKLEFNFEIRLKDFAIKLRLTLPCLVIVDKFTRIATTVTQEIVIFPIPKNLIVFTHPDSDDHNNMNHSY